MNHFNEGNKFYTEKQFQKAINSYRLSIDSNVNVASVLGVLNAINRSEA